MKTQRTRWMLRLMALLVAAAVLLPPRAVRALDDDEFGGYPSDTLLVQVGYPGGPYHDKRLYTLSELEGMDVVYADYTFLDNMPSVIIDHVKGVRLADIIDAAGIELGEVKKFHFWIQDKKESSYVTLSKASLIDTPRYCYYSLPDNFDYDEGVGNEYAASDAQQVDTVMALADDWNRVIAGATFGSDFLNLRSNTRFRLIFGQTDTTTRTASQSAKWVYAVVAELGGTPTLALDAAEVTMAQGGVFHLNATVTAADPVIVENEPVVWSSDNEGVATVDESGAVTARGAGNAVITADFRGVTATAAVTVMAADTQAEPAAGGGAKGRGGTASAGKGTSPRPDSAATPSQSPQSSTAPVESPTPTPSAQPPKQTPPPPRESTVEQDQPRSGQSDAAKEALSLPVIGSAAIVLLVGGGLLVQLFSRLKAKKGPKPPGGQGGA